MKKLFQFIFNEDGSMGEYALLIALITITVIIIAVSLGQSICQSFNSAVSALNI